jgi:hypothetical protein
VTAPPVCWHCLLADIAIEWRASAKYPGSFAGYVHRAKVCVVYPTGQAWAGKVFLVVDDQFPVAPFTSRPDAERWCTETVRRWFGQLDHR